MQDSLTRVGLWQMNAKGSADRAAEAWLSGDTRAEAAEFARARTEVSRTARPDLLARVELLRCAARAAALDFEPCTGFDALASDAAPAEQAYARYLKGDAQVADAPLLPAAHRGLVGATAAPDAALAGIGWLVSLGASVPGGHAGVHRLQAGVLIALRRLAAARTGH